MAQDRRIFLLLNVDVHDKYTTASPPNPASNDSAFCLLIQVVSTGQRNTLSLKERWSVCYERQRYQRGFSATEKTELWDRWRRGESLKAIGRAFGKPSSSIYFQLAPHGQIRPPPRRRSRLALTFLEREEISRGIAADKSARSMARARPLALDGSREISRNGGYHQYRAALADERGLGGRVVRSVVSWRTTRRYDGQWRESSD